ncbi:hypothetical protein [Bacillus cereus]|uniref:hypothetical protein n=1 Tax=Bacillus cereus TaxID=1396 RepID=UPI00398092E0
MLELSEFTPTFKVPYYLPCMFPLFHERLKGEESESLLGLHPALDFLSMPIYLRHHKNSTKNAIKIWEGHRLGYKNGSEHLGYRGTLIEFSSFEEGLKVIKENVRRQKLTLVCGTSYYLPYFEDYKNSDYIRNYSERILGVVAHWLSIYGIDNNFISVYDPTPNKYLGKVPIEEFKEFWKGDYSIDELKPFPGVSELPRMGFFDIEVFKKHNKYALRELAFKFLKTQCIEYLKSPHFTDNEYTYFFGKRAALELCSDIKKDFEGEIEESIISNYKICVSECKYSRYFLRDLLKELGHNYTVYLEEFEKIAQGWETIDNIFTLNFIRNPKKRDYVSSVVALIESIIKKEEEFYNKLLLSHNKYETLDKVD